MGGEAKEPSSTCSIPLFSTEDRASSDKLLHIFSVFDGSVTDRQEPPSSSPACIKTDSGTLLRLSRKADLYMIARINCILAFEPQARDQGTLLGRVYLGHCARVREARSSIQYETHWTVACQTMACSDNIPRHDKCEPNDNDGSA